MRRQPARQNLLNLPWVAVIELEKLRLQEKEERKNNVTVLCEKSGLLANRQPRFCLSCPMYHFRNGLTCFEASKPTSRPFLRIRSITVHS